MVKSPSSDKPAGKDAAQAQVDVDQITVMNPPDDKAASPGDGQLFSKTEITPNKPVTEATVHMGSQQGPQDSQSIDAAPPSGGPRFRQSFEETPQDEHRPAAPASRFSDNVLDGSDEAPSAGAEDGQAAAAGGPSEL